MHLRTLREQILKQFKSRVAKRILILGGGLLLLLLLLDLSLPPNLVRFQTVSTLIYDKDGELLSVALSKDEYWRIKASLKQIDPSFIKMLIHYEDKRFYYHPGIDPFAICRALIQWCKAGRVISGGSTITLQTVRLLEPRKRNVRSKIIECLRAIQLEAHYSKNEILEMYLSLAPYGGNVEGINAASLRYFGKLPHQLRVSEAALLVVMPQLPNHLRSELYPERATRFRNKVISRLTVKGVLSEQQAREAKEETVPFKIISFPRHALHILNIAVANKETAYYTFLDKLLQVQVEHLLKSELPFLEPTQTIAIMIVENKTHMIRAYVGNADFFDENRHGQVNMIEHIRSPGSTLKPFIYGMGFDDGIIHPETILDDIPTSYGEYAPSNFKDIFHGEVTVREALQHSLNIPAITVLDKIKPGRFMAHLQNCGIKMHFKSATTKASLPIALGGVGITLRDLVSLYVSLGNEGTFIPINLGTGSQHGTGLQHSTHNTNSLQLLSPYATWHINHILEGTAAPEGFVNGDITEGPVIAYKTGTSYGFRDAWAIGYTKDYTIGVWVGKPDGTPSTNQTGRQNAAPLVFKLMRFLPNPTVRLTANAPPSHPLSLSTKLLPLSLRKFEFKAALNKIPGKSFYIQFPKDGMIIHAAKDENVKKDVSVKENENCPNFEKITPLKILFKGGVPPYFLFCNGEIVEQNVSTQRISWQPTTLGFHELTLVDSSGSAETITVELQ